MIFIMCHSCLIIYACNFVWLNVYRLSRFHQRTAGGKIIIALYTLHLTLFSHSFFYCLLCEALALLNMHGISRSKSSLCAMVLYKYLHALHWTVFLCVILIFFFCCKVMYFIYCLKETFGFSYA